jgi:alginate O-acetyltransferase complex protein AlgI
MNFSSPLFLFAFLPLTLIIYLFVGSKYRQWVFTSASLLFCLWAGPLLFPVIIISTVVNFLLGRSVHHRRIERKPFKPVLISGIIFNVALMLGFKLLVAYGPAWVSNLTIVWPDGNITNLEPYLLKGIALPVGISFYSFQAIAYLLDIAANISRAETSIITFVEYMTAFPKVVAGPIVRYRDLHRQLGSRGFDWLLAGEGANRFIFGLAKKTIIADRLSLMVDSGVFDQALPNLSTPSAWLVLVCYTLQIYFDFSGYSDMAIGLGMIFGLRFPENFNYPYNAKSISEFWRRWHMTLSGFFRDVVFYPMERKRASGNRWFSQYSNVIILFLLTGLWHGVTINFIIWGFIHGLAVCLETSRIGKRMRKLSTIIQHIYTLTVLMFAWIFFRSNSLAFALGFIKNLIGVNTSTFPTPYSILAPPTTSLWITLVIAVVFSFPIFEWVNQKISLKNTRSGKWIQVVISLVLLGTSLVILAGTTYHPYIYGNF